MENNEILKSIKEEMTTKEQEFNKVINELNILEQNYVAQKSQLEASKEQIRGAYTVLYRQYEKFAKVDTTSEVENAQKVDKSEPVEEQKVEEQKVVEPKKETKPKTTKSTSKETKTTKNEKTATGLTPEEIAKINNTIPKTNVVDEKGNEVPDYLQSEYKK